MEPCRHSTDICDMGWSAEEGACKGWLKGYLWKWGGRTVEEKLSSMPEMRITSQHNFQPWLATLPEDRFKPAAQVLSCRAALRVLPLMHTIFSTEKYTPAAQKRLLLSALRATLVSRFAARYPAQLSTSTAIAASAYQKNLNAPPAAVSAAFAALCAASSVSDEIIPAATHSVVIATEAAGKSGADIWASVTDDARWLAAGLDPIELLGKPLWSEGKTPDWWIEAKRRFEARLELTDRESNRNTQSNAHWRMWTNWYHSVASARMPWKASAAKSWKLEERIAVGDGRGVEFWDREPEVINREIAGWIDEAPPAKVHSDSVNLAQRPSAFVFNASENSISATPFQETSEIDPALCDALWAEMLGKLRNTRSRLMATQAPRHVIDSFDRIIVDFGTKFSDLSPGILLSRSRTIESIASTYNTPETRDEMAADALAMMQDAANSLADLRGLFPSLVKIEAARVAQQMVSSDAPAIMGKSAEIIEIARESDIVDQSAINALEMVIPEFEESQRLIEMAVDDTARAAALEKRAEIVSLHVLDIRNFGSSAISAAKPNRFLTGVKRAGKKVATDLGSDAYSGVRSGVKKVSEVAVVGGYSALVAALADPFWGLATYLLSMRPLGTKASEIKQEHEDASKEQEAEAESGEVDSDRVDK